MYELQTILTKELQTGENVFITTQAKLNSTCDENWWEFKEFAPGEVLYFYNAKSKVAKYWHEDGLCIILK